MLHEHRRNATTHDNVSITRSSTEYRKYGLLERQNGLDCIFSILVLV